MRHIDSKIGIGVLIAGLVALISGLFSHFIERFFFPRSIIIVDVKWAILVGIIFIAAGIYLLGLNKKRSFAANGSFTVEKTEAILMLIVVLTTVFTMGMVYGEFKGTVSISTKNFEKLENELTMMDSMEAGNPFYTKKVIIRDDDISDSERLTSVKWLSDLAVDRDVKITYSVIPASLVESPETIDYLKSLDMSYFEFAAHGYEHELFKDMPYEEQYSRIENATNILEQTLGYRPVTFVPPQGTGDVNTTKACKMLGYHSITDVMNYPSYIVDFRSDYEWEKSYEPVTHRSYDEFKTSYDGFYNSSDQYYLIYLHDWTFQNENGDLNRQRTGAFENATDYMKKDNVQFMTIDEAYMWHVDEYSVMTYMTDDLTYSIDLTECRYDHNIRFNSPVASYRQITVKDINTSQEEIFHEKSFDFEGKKGHWYEVSVRV